MIDRTINVFTFSGPLLLLMLPLGWCCSSKVSGIGFNHSMVIIIVFLKRERVVSSRGGDKSVDSH